MQEPFDPKTEVTEHAFVIPNHILGQALATPFKRLFAFLLDLLLVAILSGLGFYTLSGLLAVLGYKKVRNRDKVGALNKFRNRTWAAAAAFGIFVFSFSILSIFDKDESSDKKNLTTTSTNSQIEKSISSADIEQLKSLSKLNSDSLQNIKLSHILEKAIDIVEQIDSPKSTNEYRLSVNDLAHLELFLNLSASENSYKTYDSLRSVAVKVLAKPEISALKKKLSSLSTKMEDLEEKNESLNEQIENPSFISMFFALANDFGFAFGWGSLYFVFSVAWFNGQTVAKRLLKLRVIKLNGKPIGIWYSFERFGGYAAGIATGLLGFLQIFWDPNRQAVHDKISGTVVIDETKKQDFNGLQSD
jgi:hypothetical protein